MSLRLGLPSLVLAGLLVGCGGIPFLTPDTRTPVDRARAVDPKCEGFDETTAAPLLSPGVVDSVEPAYSYVKSGPDDREAQLQGAKIHVKPRASLSREAMTRDLECHEARVVLGRAALSADDPYVLEGEWLTIDVDSEGDGFVVLVRADRFDAARRVLQRAKRFTATPGAK